jgi:hypothetical protein
MTTLSPAIAGIARLNANTNTVNTAKVFANVFMMLPLLSLVVDL